MTDTTEAPIRWEWRYGLGIVVLLFNAGVIWWCIVNGKSENLLHQNALSWSFITGMVLSVILVGGAIAAQVLPILPLLKKP